MPYLFDQEPYGLVTFNPLLVTYVPQYFDGIIFVFKNTITFFVFVVHIHNLMGMNHIQAKINDFEQTARFFFLILAKVNALEQCCVTAALYCMTPH